MSKCYGLNPEPATKQMIEQFENTVMIRHNNQQLISSVYVDMQDALWAVAFAYNLSHHTGLHRHENLLEVKYSYSLIQKSQVQMFRSDPDEEKILESEQFESPDAFIRYVINHERRLLDRPA
jgi:hypothetical protein